MSIKALNQCFFSLPCPLFFRFGFLCFRRVCFLYCAMVCVKNFFLPFKPHVHITRCDCFKIHRKSKRYTDTRERMSQDLAHCVEVARQLVHIRSRCMPLRYNNDKRKSLYFQGVHAFAVIYSIPFPSRNLTRKISKKGGCFINDKIS
jgi:hypothetical protein